MFLNNNSNFVLWARGSAWIERTASDREVGGSNRFLAENEKDALVMGVHFVQPISAKKVLRTQMARKPESPPEPAYFLNLFHNFSKPWRFIILSTKRISAKRIKQLATKIAISCQT